MKRFKEKQGNYHCHRKDRNRCMASNAMHLTSLIHFVQWTRDVSALRWRSYTCPFCGSANYPVFLRNLFITCYYYSLHSRIVQKGKKGQ